MAALTAERELLQVRELSDVPPVRRAARAAATELGFDRIATESIVLASIELATNLVRYAGGGTMRLIVLAAGPRGAGLAIESSDCGPGIANVEQAMTDGFSSGGGLGGGLPGVRRLMDELTIESAPGKTTIVATKWLVPR